MPVLNGQADGQVIINIAANNQNAVNTIQNTVTQAQNAGRQIENNVRTTAQNSENSIAKSLKGIVSAISAAGIAKKVLDIGKAAIQAASDLEEVQNVVDTTFGASSGKIDAWAKNAIKQYGLTETKAKKFASTIGSTLKSMGVEENQLLDVSESLAGLAADMASFYNLDFDTAFEKLRSGLIGQAEPLKALGINMSAANLQAFALSKGIQTAVDKMSASEQAMLRYEYIMQATSDAQGDFARTSDGMANGLRLLESQIETLKTTIGEHFLGSVTSAITSINDMISLLIPEEKPRTILDDFADIDKQTQTKLAKIEEARQKTEALIGMLGEIERANPDAAKFNNAAAGIGNVSESLARINQENVTAFQDVVDAVEGLGNAKSIDSAASGVSTIANAVGKNNVTKTKSDAWKELLEALSTNASGLTGLTTQSGQSVAGFLHGLSEEAATLNETDVNSWERLFGLLTQELPQASDTEEGQTFSGLLSSALGQESAAVQSATNYLEALGIATGDVATDQATWLEICQRLVKEQPELSNVINTQTGEIRMSKEELQSYNEELLQARENAALLENIQQKRAAYESSDDLVEKHVEAIEARLRADRAMTAWEEYYGKSVPQDKQYMAGYSLEEYKRARDTAKQLYGWKAVGAKMISEITNETSDALSGIFNYFLPGFNDLGYDDKQMLVEYEKYLSALDEAEAAERGYTQAVEDRQEALRILGEAESQVADATQLNTRYTQEQIDAWNTSIETATELSQAVSGYYQSTREDMLKTVQSVVTGFDKMQTPAQKARADIQELGDVTDEVKQKYQQNIPTISNMLDGLQSQLDYMTEYQQMLNDAKIRGVSDDILAFLSDGSQESYDYLRAIVGTYDENLHQYVGSASREDIKQLNEKYADVQTGQESFADTLTSTTLKADDAFQGLVISASKAISGLNLEADAKDAVASTVDGIAQGIKDRIPEVSAQIDALAAELNRLSSFGVNFNLNNGVTWYDPYSGYKIMQEVNYNGGTGSHAAGLDYVPFDGYLAQLHQGESILTAEESAAWRAMRVNAGNKQAGFDYGTLASSVWDGAPAMGGGNVYLDGQTVGRVISARQADTYRALTRSGWQQ